MQFFPNYLITLTCHLTDARATQEARDVTKRSLESGTPGDPIMAEIFGSGGKKARVSNHGPFSIVRTREEVDMQWARASVSAGLPMSFFDNKEVRKAVLMTAECGQSYIRSQDQTWWCQGTHTVTPHVFHYQTYPKTRQVD